MAQDAADETGSPKKGRKRSWLRNGLRGALLLLLVTLAIGWFQREQIADGLITDALAESGLPATYEIEEIGPTRQVLTNLVIGDPDEPDMTIERLELSLSPRWGLPDIAELRIVRPRLYGTYRDGTLSFGALDPLIFTEDEAQGEFPNMELFIEDGRGMLDADFGRVGFRLDGGGHLRGGFNAELAAVGEDVVLGGCFLEAPSIYGTASIDAERPHFVGPLRFDALDCPDTELALQGAAVQLDVLTHRNFVDFEGDYGLALAGATVGDTRSGEITGEGRFSWRDGALVALYDLGLRDLATGAVSAGLLSVDGRVRATDSFARVDVEGDVAGEAIELGEALDTQLAGLAVSSEGTFAAPLLTRLRRNLGRELAGSELSARFDARRMGELTSVVVPEARLRGSSGASILALSRTTVSLGEGGLPAFSGNVLTGGTGLPQISGRMEQARGGALVFRMTMREYAAGEARLAVPRMAISQGTGDRFVLDGEVLASGPLPGGFADNLRLPVDGTVNGDGAIALWNGCRDMRFDRLAYSNLTLARQALRLCPAQGQPILRYDNSGLRLAAGTNALNLVGELAETPLRVASGPIGFAYPGALAARDMQIGLGPQESGQNFVISDLRANLFAQDIGGEFSGVDVFLGAVPLDVLEASGTWRYADSRLEIDEVRFMLEDREEVDRFQPLYARGASLTLADNRITADALLRHPGSDSVVSDVTIAHDLATATGNARLAVPGITFGERLEITDLTQLALGVVANMEGTVTGEGRIEWTPEAVTSSGEFSTDSLDLAAPFGPVQGASGAVVFTDLLGRTTAPDQRIRLAAINPGIEVYDGEVGFRLINGETLAVTGGSWPFMGGTLRMHPVDINIGVEEYRTYTMEIEGLQAARFIERMEMSNLAASGTFDGTIPIIFDPEGNGHLVGGQLISREPGGNLSYIGELTYEDMGFFANYAFQTLRDLAYDRMEIDMNGPLTGELVTQVRFEGISQGPSASRNFVSRAIADLPIELRINIRAPFFKLMSSLRALYDPASVRDPRDLGLILSDGTRARDAVDQETVDAQDEAAAEEAARELSDALVPPDERRREQSPDETIQPPESEAMR
ncbi:intermembrane phospholipid transport protein YdbH family protein [Aurantiacibacter sp. D1-12]|uniref:intermembrane phospholipid transport protein YdbH family protein n=1 Tax=Aurantiacibacter sp. D1-12 TaxID=2993658 RepID=UPI00237C8EB8|nr:YdbH domain-containing protein [Aurantiacibacter sp. D1-12]MDE1468378.1 YdbH domain-containing protein [Aurantiacibacter sp. D1-12]